MKKNITLILFPMSLLLCIVACERPTKAINDAVEYGWNEYKNPVISQARLRDTLSKKIIEALNIVEINGIRASYPSGKYTLYFEYETDPEKLLSSLARLPFEKTNAVSDTTCRSFSFPFSLSGKSLLSKKEVRASSFFWQIDPKAFLYYECLKAPERHTILIHKITGRIFHRIESIVS